MPLWTSATLEGVRTSLYLWSRCDGEFEGVLPEKCTWYDNDLCLDIDLFERNLEEAAEDLEDGFGLSMIYYSGVDDISHALGCL